MNKSDVMLLTLIIQVAVQLTLYFGTCTLFKNLIKKPVLGLSMCHKLWGMTRQQAANSIVAGLLLAYNIGISALVLWFTNSSALAGMSSMGASVIVAIVMFVEFSSIGRHYIQVPKESAWKKFVSKLHNKGEEDGDY